MIRVFLNAPYQEAHDAYISLLMLLTWITWFRWCLLGFSALKLHIFLL